jgi:glycosyltransferase involved in cell wall biosynthesis
MGAALEFVQKGRNGWLVSAGDEVALLNAMRESAENELPQGARESVSEHTLENGAERFAQYANKELILCAFASSFAPLRETSFSCVVSQAF